MKKVELKLPENFNEFDELSLTDRSQLLDGFYEIKTKMNNVVEMFIEDALGEILSSHPEIESVYLDPKYEYNDEGYAPMNIMPFINGEYFGEDGEDLFEQIDEACAGFSAYITEGFEVDVNKVRTRYNAKKLDGELTKKRSTKKGAKV